MDYQTVSFDCFGKKTIDIDNIYGKQYLLRKKDCAWYKNCQIPTINDNLSNYICVDKESECTISRKNQDQNMAQIRQEIISLRKEVEELKFAEECRRYDNIICDCVSSFYKMIVRKVNRDHKDIKLPTWELLTDAAENDTIISGYIDEAIASFNISSEQWTKIREFKYKRNMDSHFEGPRDICAKNTLNILASNVNNTFPEELKSGLMIVAIAVLNGK